MRRSVTGERVGGAGRRGLGVPGRARGRQRRESPTCVNRTVRTRERPPDSRVGRPVIAGTHKRPEVVRRPWRPFPQVKGPTKSSRVVVRDRIELSTFRFSGECPGPRESTTVRPIRPDELLGHLGVQDRPHVSTSVVSAVLASGLCIRRPLTFLSRSGESGSRVHSPGVFPCSIRLRWPLAHDV